MNYIKINIEGRGEAYMEISNGVVARYLSADGGYLYDSIPVGVGSEVVDDAPVQKTWML
jgi:hypothetical protein